MGWAYYHYWNVINTFFFRKSFDEDEFVSDKLSTVAALKCLASFLGSCPTSPSLAVTVLAQLPVTYCTVNRTTSDRLTVLQATGSWTSAWEQGYLASSGNTLAKTPGFDF